jgi:endonuclease G, mitochondrial
LLPKGPVPDELKGPTEQAAKKITTGAPLDPDEQFALEAIIIPDKRPAVDIVKGDYEVAHPLWKDFNTDPIKANIKKAIPSVGRVELPNDQLLPYAGTGFVVGPDVLMTNRHVAEIFSAGLGLRELKFLPGREAGIDFLREVGNATPHVLGVREILMIHPYWDMALLRVDGLLSEHAPLTLSLTHPEDLAGQDVAVIGYPAFDPRNDTQVQNSVFRGLYNVKRLQPGKIGQRRSIMSFGKTVSAATHDSSTLGGNSGSVVLWAKTGTVVGLHFSGVYLDANFAVPSSELARDGRVLDGGVKFEGHPAAEPHILG